MNKLIKYGIRFTDDISDWGLDGPYVYGALQELTEHFSNTGKRFFFDTADTDQHVIGGKKVQDVFGWIVETSEAEGFQREWLKLNDEALGGTYVCVKWKDGDGKPVPTFIA